MEPRNPGITQKTEDSLTNRLSICAGRLDEAVNKLGAIRYRSFGDTDSGGAKTSPDKVVNTPISSSIYRIEDILTVLENDLNYILNKL